jgi:hypothetical protein
MISHANPLHRWRVGHHLFFVLIQGLILALRRFELATTKSMQVEAALHLESATSLLWASAVVMRFAGDFPEKDYDDQVRSTMMPPRVSDGFSGLLSHDHRVMLEILKRLRPVFAQLPAGLERPRDRFLAALNSAYECHIFVCRRFAGDKAPSLRTATGNARSAVEVLEKFRQSRIELVAPVKVPTKGCPIRHKDP